MLGLQHTFNQNTGLFYFEYIFIKICLKPDTGGTLKVLRHCIVLQFSTKFLLVSHVLGCHVLQHLLYCSLQN